MKKRILAVILTLVMLLGMVPVSALAAEDTPITDDSAIVGVTLDQTALELTVGGTAELQASVELNTTITDGNATDTRITWSSSDNAVATVDENGAVTAVSEGIATIIAAVGGKSAECAVSVTAAQAEETYLLTGLEVAVGGKTIETAVAQTLTPAFAGTVTEYTTPVLDYESNSDNRHVWLKVTAVEGTTVTAKCGSSDTATLASGEWCVLQKQGGYWWSPSYTGSLEVGTYNQVIITVSKEGETDKVYTVTVPMQPDISNRSLNWKTDLKDAIYYTKNDENAALTVEAQYKNRPLGNTDPILYQWYKNTTRSTEGAVAIEGATAATYNPPVDTAGTVYYYAVASCKDLESITSKIIAITVTDEAAPISVSLVCDYPYTIPNDWEKALGGVSYVAKVGDTMRIKAVDENGKETPVVWNTSSMYGGTLDKDTGIYTVTGSSYSYLEAISLYDASITSGEMVIEVEDYAFTANNKTPSVTLSNDGQTPKSIATQGGVEGYNIWSYTLSEENIAVLNADLSTKPLGLKFDALRPGTITAAFDLDLGGDGVGDGKGLTDTATLTINGISVEDAAGTLTKTYLEISTETPNPTIQLKALSSTETPVFTWSSADETVATVDEKGLVTAKGVGSVIISATDGTYTGGIKVVVTSAETPYFEQIDFTTTTAWGNGLSNASWTSANFKATTLEYTGLKLTKAAASTLTLSAATIYNTDKYTAVATYTDANGEAQSVTINSGAVTNLANLPFETSTVTITIADKTDESKKTVYTFEITRPRDTTKTIASSGIVFVPDGRDVWKDKYNEKTEGIMYVASEDGSFAQYQGVSATRYYYRTYAMNGLEAFSLTLKGGSAYAHIRFSVDDGANWTYLGQTGTGVTTGKITIPTPVGEEHSVVKVMVQILDDAAYSSNVAAGKDGFADATPNTYNLWVEQIPVLSAECDILTATTPSGDWYPTFDKSRTSYRILVAPESEAPVLTYTVSDGAVVTIGDVVQTPDENGNYTLTLATGVAQDLVISASDGMTKKTYSFGYSERESIYVPDKVVDFLTVNSQYINGNGGGYGFNPQQTLTGGLLSLGNFGGYVTFYMANGLTDDPSNAYGVDFYVNGNAFKDTSTGTGLGSMEPGQVWVSEDGSAWYALAGSEHYEPGTLWNYAVTYTKTETGGTSWQDNYGNTDATTHGRSFAWPSAEVYTMNNLPKQDSFTLSGILLPCVDGTITGTDSFNSFSKGGRFGYVDMLPNGTNNPYLNNADYSNASSGFDLAWAVDGAGNPVDVSGKSFHYVKVVTASNIMAGAANEKSTEVGNLVRAVGQGAAVGVTTAPTGVTISDGDKSQSLTFESGKQIYEMDLGDMEYISILVNGTAESDNIYVNNQRVASGTAATGIRVSGTQKLVRIIVQNGQKEPVIYLLKLSRSTGTETLIDSVKITVEGAGRLADTTNGKTFSAEVGYRVESIGITPNVVSGAEVTINGKAVQDKYALTEGENAFTIQASKNGVTQSVTLTVNREKTPESTGKITVYFTLLGDTLHGSNGTAHTLAGGNLSTWISRTAFEMDTPAAVVDLIDLATKGKYNVVNGGGNYISSINGLGEMDNGPNSGWMYTINGYHSQLGVAEQQLKDGDVIVLHYSDDWTLENSQNTGSTDPAVKAVEDAIYAIGDVSLDSKEKIDAARAAYDELTPAQKAKVGNITRLTAAETKYAKLQKEADEKAAKTVIDAISKLNKDFLTYEQDVKAAYEAYNKLTDAQKELVSNYDQLAKALKDLATEEDKKKAEEVKKLIAAIDYKVTVDSETKIKAARSAYDKLTDTQKALVENYKKLTDAEKELAIQKKLAGYLDIYDATGDYMETLGAPVSGNIGGEWMVLGLLRGGRELEHRDEYYESVLKFVEENIDENGRLHHAKSTENSRIILALTAMGLDVTNVGGHDLLRGLSDMTFLQKQGINGPIWALIALDSGNYELTEGDVTREALIQLLLDKQLEDGGWALSGESSDADITGMALQALAPYYADTIKETKAVTEKIGKELTEAVKTAVDEALEAVSIMQQTDGGFSTYSGGNGQETTSESTAQILAALSALGIDASRDERFLKNGKTPLDALSAYFVQGGGFRHLLTGDRDGMATEQGYYALSAFFRLIHGKTGLYDMSDVTKKAAPATPVEASTMAAFVGTLETVKVAAPIVPVENDTHQLGDILLWVLGVAAVCVAVAAAALFIYDRKTYHGKH